MDSPNFFAELKRRNVYKVAVAYGVVGWLVVQIGTSVFPTFHAPDWVAQRLIVLVVLGFPVALVIAWAFEMTPEGMKRTEEVSPGKLLPQWGRSGHAAEAIEILRLLLSIPGGAQRSIPILRIHPVWDPIRSEPAFQELLKVQQRVGP